VLLLIRILCASLAIAGWAGAVRGAEVVVQVQNLSPTDGFWLSTVWVGFHDGSFDLFDAGVHTMPGGGLERLAEDGNPQPLQAEFAQQTPGGTSGVIAASEGVGDLGFIGPGQTVSLRFTVDPVTQRFMSFAAAVLPSNDAFIGNDDQDGIELFSETGWWWGTRVMEIGGCDVWDAGTEWNTMKDAAFLNQSTPNTGIATVADVVPHSELARYNLFGAPTEGATNSLGVAFDPQAADFVTGNCPVCRIVVIPEPATAILLVVGGLMLRGLPRRRRSAIPARGPLAHEL
jgi:hypothetical protein